MFQYFPLTQIRKLEIRSHKTGNHIIGNWKSRYQKRNNEQGQRYGERKVDDLKKNEVKPRSRLTGIAGRRFEDLSCGDLSEQSTMWRFDRE